MSVTPNSSRKQGQNGLVREAVLGQQPQQPQALVRSADAGAQPQTHFTRNWGGGPGSVMTVQLAFPVIPRLGRV